MAGAVGKLRGAVASGSFYQRMSRLVTMSGGKIEDKIFVTKPGCLLLAKTELNTTAASPQANAVRDLFSSFHSKLQLTHFDVRSFVNGALLSLGS
jgi:hypothetical protein